MFHFFVRSREINNREKPVVIITMFLVIKIESGIKLFKIFNMKYKSTLRPISIMISLQENCI